MALRCSVNHVKIRILKDRELSTISFLSIDASLNVCVYICDSVDEKLRLTDMASSKDFKKILFTLTFLFTVKSIDTQTYIHLQKFHCLNDILTVPFSAPWERTCKLIFLLRAISS